MSYLFQAITANDEKNVNILASMHHLRWTVFHQELRWSVGLHNYNCMEFDDYDQPYATYIVRTNPDNEVDACCRLIPTDRPYMLAERYPEFIETMDIPKSPQVWEATRFAATNEARKQSQGKIMAQMIASMIEFGLQNDITNYISLTTDNVAPILKKSGWDSRPVGQKRPTPDDNAYALIHTVSEEMLHRVREKNSLPVNLLSNIREITAQIMEPNNGKILYGIPSNENRESGPTTKVI